MVTIDRDLRADKQINKNLLDEEAEMQPYVYGEWAEMVVRAKEDVDRAKLTLDKVKAERFMYHKTPDEPGEKPATDKMAEHLRDSDPEVIAAHEAHIEANKIWGLCKVAEESMQQKRSMIKVLEHLHTTKYFDREAVDAITRENKKKTRTATVAAIEKDVAEMSKKRKKKKKKVIKLEPIIEEKEEEEDDIYGDDLDEEDQFDSTANQILDENDEQEETEELYDETEGIGTTDPELEEENDLDIDIDEEEEEVITPPKNKRTVKSKGMGEKLKAQKSKKLPVKEQAALNQIEGKRLQAEAAKKKKANKPKGKCPYGYSYGEDFGLEPECDECTVDNACFKARPKN